MSVYVFLADGFEEAEALIPTDMLIRGGADVTCGQTGNVDFDSVGFGICGLGGFVATHILPPFEILKCLHHLSRVRGNKGSYKWLLRPHPLQQANQAEFLPQDILYAE